MLANVPAASVIFLILALLLALSFEFVNGFHDTANAVATVIYTNTLKPTIAVIWSGMWNLIGVLTSSGAVAFGIVSLLPVELVLNVSSGAGFAMVFSLLISAIIWNVGTWYLGLPASSSHTLIGSIIGVGLANSLMAKGYAFGEGVNWAKAKDIGMSLLISPMIGFFVSALLFLLIKLLVNRPELFKAPAGKTPPLWIRGLLVLTCTGVSFAHGSNDGQKGMGLIMLILIGIVPASFAVSLNTNQASIQDLVATSQVISADMDKHAAGVTMTQDAANQELSAFLKPSGQGTPNTFAAVASTCREITTLLTGKSSLNELAPDQRRTLRNDLFLSSGTLGKMNKKGILTDPDEKKAAASMKGKMDKVTQFIPVWVKVAVAIALGFGTMIGWKRIVVTVGERIGKQHLTYAQGAAAEIVAYGTIQAADVFGLPVSTTHVLSSGIAGTMMANNSGLQMKTLRNIILAWVLTLPACIFLGATLFAFGLNVVLNMLGMK